MHISLSGQWNLWIPTNKQENATIKAIFEWFTPHDDKQFIAKMDGVGVYSYWIQQLPYLDKHIHIGNNQRHDWPSLFDS